SAYGNHNILNEDISEGIPSFIRSGSTYFKERQHDLHAMIRTFGAPQLFLTLSAAEDRWPDLQHVLATTDSGNTSASHRPVHSAIHFLNRYHYLRKKILKSVPCSGFGALRAYFSRKEFQRRSMTHVHDLYWTTKTIPQLIRENYIRADIPDPLLEPELYH